MHLSDKSGIIHIIFFFSALEHLSCIKQRHTWWILELGKRFFGLALFSEREQPSTHGCDLIAFQMQPSKATLGIEQFHLLCVPSCIIKICPVDDFNIAVILFWYLASANITTISLSGHTKLLVHSKSQIGISLDGSQQQNLQRAWILIIRSQPTQTQLEEE